MFSCWHADANKRPNFANILEKLDNFISQNNADDLIHISFLNACERFATLFSH